MKRIAPMLVLSMAISFSFFLWAESQWVQTGGPGGGEVSAIAVSQTGFLIGTHGGGVFLSRDNGTSWVAANSGLPPFTWVWGLGTNGEDLFVCVENLDARGGRYPVYHSSDSGASWALANSGLPKLRMAIQCFAAVGSNIYAGTWGEGVFSSADKGKTWKPDNSGLPNACWVEALSAIGSDLYAGTARGVYRLAEGSRSWTALNLRLPEKDVVHALAAVGKILFAGTRTGVYRSSNGGESWTACNSGLPKAADVRALAAIGPALFASTRSGAYRSSDNGEHWTLASPRLPAGFRTGAIAAAGTSLIATIDIEGEQPYAFFRPQPYRVFRSLDNGTSWTPSEAGLANASVVNLAVAGSTLFAYARSGGFMSTDDGASWKLVNSRYPGIDWIRCVGRIGSKLFAGSNAGVLMSMDNGTSWKRASGGLPEKADVASLAVAGRTLFASTLTKVFQSNDEGRHWREIKIELREKQDAEEIYGLAVIGEDLFALAGCEGISHIFLSTKRSRTWTAFIRLPVYTSEMELANGERFVSCESIAAKGRELLVAGQSAIYAFTDKGGGLEPVGRRISKENWISCLEVSGTAILAGIWGFGGGVWFSTDDGGSWKTVNSGLANTRIGCLAIKGTDLYAGTDGCGVWRFPLFRLPNK